MPVLPPLGWAGLVERVNDVGTFNGDGPRAAPLDAAIDSVNHIATRGRVLMGLHLPVQITAPVAGAINLLGLRYPERNNNGKELLLAVLLAPGNTAVASLNEVRIDGTAVVAGRHARATAAPTIPGELLADMGTLTIVPSGADINRVLSVFDGARPVALCLVERPGAWPYELTGTDHHVPDRPEPGSIITTPVHVDLRETEQEIWTRLRDVYCFSAPINVAALTFASAANPTLWRNIRDATAARTVDTWGVPISALSGGRGLDVAVSAQCSIYAQLVGGGGGDTGEVRFISSQGSVDIVGITAAGWYDAATKLQIDARPAASSTDGRDWDKVDIMRRRVGGAGDVVVTRWRVGIAP